MVGEQLFFDMVDLLEPKCPGCETILKYGDNTRYDDKFKGHVCLSCGRKLK